MKQSEIYIPLLDEGTDVCRITQGEKMADDVFKVLSAQNYDPDDEHWLYPPGTLVRCEKTIRSGKEVLLAVERI